jgi:hypothetical protein
VKPFGRKVEFAFCRSLRFLLEGVQDHDAVRKPCQIDDPERARAIANPDFAKRPGLSSALASSHPAQDRAGRGQAGSQRSAAPTGNSRSRARESPANSIGFNVASYIETDIKSTQSEYGD